MAGVSDSLRVQLTTGKVSAADEYSDRAPFSPVTNRISNACSISKKSARSGTFTSSPFRYASENQAALQDVSIISTSLQALEQAEGATSSRFCVSPLPGSAETGSNNRHKRHARTAPMASGSKATDIAQSSSRRLASMASLESEVSFSQIAEEAQNLAHSLHEPVRPLVMFIQRYYLSVNAAKLA